MKSESYLFITLVVICLSCKTTISIFQTTDPDKMGVKSNKFSGTIFTSSYPQNKLFFSDTLSLRRFTPNEKQIKQAEETLASQIQEFNNHKLKQEKDRYIDKNLKSYFRQYFGYIDNIGDSIIHINFSWNKYTLSDKIKGYGDSRLTYTSDYSITLDGGSEYWNVDVNLTKQKLESLYVNGSA